MVSSKARFAARPSSLTGSLSTAGCVSILCMGRPTRTSLTGASAEYLARWGAAAACLGAISYGASGYLDNPDASGFVIGFALPVLEVATSASFLGGLLALYFWAGEGGLLRRAGFLVGSV